MDGLCIGCGTEGVKLVTDLGPQPPSNRFLARSGEPCETHRLRFGYCRACGLAQLIDPMSVDLVRSRFAWITYNEPEGHLDSLVESLREVADVTPGTRILGLTYKDDSTLARFRKHGVAETYRLDQERDLGIRDPLASLETVQERLTAERAGAIAERVDRADVLIVRHILEHAHRPSEFVEACRQLTRPGGWLVFEVPDCRKAFDGCDHCFLWEEHIAYFTPTTLGNFLDGAGFSDVQVKIYPYPMEDSLVAIARNNLRKPSELRGVEGETLRAQRFGDSVENRGAKTRNHLQSLRSKGRHVAVFGAGHLSAKFINFYRLAPFIWGVVDDNPNKQNLLMPGSALPIIASGCLDAGQVDFCLLTLNPESEQKVLKAKASYLARGGRFRSIFSSSANSLNLDLNEDRTS